MLIASMLAWQEAAGDQAYRAPSYVIPVALGLLIAGALGWLVAAVLGFTRARVFGSSVRWFALAALCLLIYHLQWLVLAVGIIGQNTDVVLSVGAFFNLFVALGAICAIVGFTRLTDPRP
jgi:hypothetical protein